MKRSCINVYYTLSNVHKICRLISTFQVEQLRASYASQSERFRDYRAAQMESMNQHLENIRENYNQQVEFDCEALNKGCQVATPSAKSQDGSYSQGKL